VAVLRLDSTTALSNSTLGLSIIIIIIIVVVVVVIIIYFALNSAVIKHKQSCSVNLRNKRNEIVSRTKRSIVNNSLLT